MRPIANEMQVRAWRDHAAGQMRSARLAKSPMVRSDCVACARACRRQARWLAKGQR